MSRPPEMKLWRVDNHSNGPLTAMIRADTAGEAMTVFKRQVLSASERAYPFLSLVCTHVPEDETVVLVVRRPV